MLVIGSRARALRTALVAVLALVATVLFVSASAIAQETPGVTAPRASEQTGSPTVAMPPEGIPETAAEFPVTPLQTIEPLRNTNANEENAAVWRQIREGARGEVSGMNRQSGVLQQTGWRSWGDFRNGPLATWSAWALLGMIALLALVFALRGRMRVERGLSGVRIKRFTLIERVAHWTLATSFILLALTGLNLVFGRSTLLPLFGPETFAALTQGGKFVHNYVAFAFMAALLTVALLWVWQNIPNRHDWVWIKKGGGFIGKGHPPAKKFNAGQKVIFWITILSGLSVSLSGWALLNPFQTTMFSDSFALLNNLGFDLNENLTPLQEQQYQSVWHALMSVFMMVVVIAHIYIGTVGMEGALDAMTRGDVDANWAEEHHALWVDEVRDADMREPRDRRLVPAE